jgi:hypothetical protein
MSAGALTASDTKATAGEFRLGSFVLDRRIDEGEMGRHSVVTAEAVGAAGTAHDGRTAVVRCAPVGTGGEAAARTAEAAARLLSVRHPALAQVIEAGVAGEVAYVVEARPAGTSIAETLRRQVKSPATAVVRMVSEIAEALNVLHAAGLAHGRVTPAAIWLAESGRPMLTGCLLGGGTVGTGRGDPWFPPEGESALANPAADQFQLAMTAAVALTGFAPRTGGVGDVLPGVPGAVVAVLARATATHPADRFPSLDAFARAFGESVTRAGDELIAGVWEAIGRRDDGMATIMLEMAQGYAPNHPDLAMLRLRLAGGPATAADFELMAALGMSTLPAPALPIESPFALPATPEEAAIAELLKPPAPASAVSKGNPWTGFAVGTFIMFAFFAIIAIFMLTYV